MRLTQESSTSEVYEVDLDLLKEEYGRELAQWQVENPGRPIADWVQEAFEEGSAVGFHYLDDESDYNEEITVTE